MIGEAIEQWQPLICPGCRKSSYDICSSWIQEADTLQPEMLRKSDPNALDPAVGLCLDCPYCGSPMGISHIFPVIGGGWLIKFTWVTKAGVTT